MIIKKLRGKNKMSVTRINLMNMYARTENLPAKLRKRDLRSEAILLESWRRTAYENATKTGFVNQKSIEICYHQLDGMANEWAHDSQQRLRGSLPTAIILSDTVAEKVYDLKHEKREPLDQIETLVA
ncbi:hypothetical protein K8R33_00795 [archaeon]|nr:hypothetical protein [archaeon]